MLKLVELRQKNTEELRQNHAKMVTDLKDLIITFVKGKEKSNQKIRNMRKDVARILTVLNEKIFLESSL